MTNPQLRIRVAEAIGWTDINTVGECIFGMPPGCSYPDHPVPQFTESADAALLLVARLKEQGWEWLCVPSGDGFLWRFSKEEEAHYGQGDTFPLAVCAAFLEVIKATQGETKL